MFIGVHLWRALCLRAWQLHASAHPEGEECHCYDDLLWYFDFVYNKVVERMEKEAEEEAAGAEAEAANNS